ncbi:MAG: T9SS type A sorting domain-containing protein [Candidatus Stahlbacteria bacterium]|nr:T9SS type A sorting domain-containing protein [Candidatus Stahlbacteria bacterium]
MLRKVLCVGIGLGIGIHLAFATPVIVDDKGDVFQAKKTDEGYTIGKQIPLSFKQSIREKGKGFIDTVILFEDAAPSQPGFYFPNRDSNTLILQLFNSPYACSLRGFGASFYSGGYGEFCVWKGPNVVPTTTIELTDTINATWTFDTLAKSWTKTPDTLFGPTPIGSDDTTELKERIGWVNIPPMDIGTEALWCGWRMLDTTNMAAPPYKGKPWPLSDKYADMNGHGTPHYAPCRTWMYRVQPNLPQFNFKWLSYGDNVGDWEFFYVIDIYDNIPPQVTMENLPGTYITTDRPLNATFYDIGIPPESTGTFAAYIIFWRNDSIETADTIPMIVTGGTMGLTDATGAGAIPGHQPWTKVTYCVGAVDFQGAVGVSEYQYSYTVGAGTPGNALVLKGGGDAYGPPWSPDPWSHIPCPVDFWDEWAYNNADSSVLNFYNDEGPGKNAIFVHTFGAGPIMRDSTFFMNFLNAGGKLAITSQDLPGEWAGDYDTLTFGPGSFVHDYLKIHQVDDDFHPDTSIHPADSAFAQYGIPDDRISGAANLADFLVAPYIYRSNLGLNFAGIFMELDPQCVTCFVDQDGNIQGYWYQDTTIAAYKLVNMYWPFQYIWTSGSRNTAAVVYNTEAQDSLAARICAWFGVGVDETPIRPASYLLSEAKPNPGQTARITYGMPRAGKVSLKIYDISGSLIRTLVNTEVKAGAHSITWDGKDNYGKSVATGIYYYKMESGDFNKTRKFVLVR